MSEIKALSAKLTTAQSLMMEKGWWTNEAGYLTDAALWIDRAMKDAEALSHMEGWRLVPIEPTEEMVEAHFAAHARAETVFASVEEVWAAMLKAAPLPPSPTGGEE